MVVSHPDRKLHDFLDDLLTTEGGRQVLQCYQCGTCSGSCPVIEEMVYGPRRILHMIHAGHEDEVLSSPDIWRCVSCYACASRCPRGIEITDLMADLRRMALARGYAQDKEAEFGLAFAETVQTHGRLFEPELLARYYLRVLDLVSLISMAPLGIRMLLKGKLPFLPERVADPQEIEAFGVVASTRPKVATGVALGRSPGSGRRRGSGKLVDGMFGGALLTVLANLLVSWGRERTR